MEPVSIALLGAGLLLKGYGGFLANAEQADAERKNASFYREQAAFAKKAGERQQEIFDRQSKVLYGEQLSAFAKAGVDTSASSYLMAKDMFYRQKESAAIKQEADFNVRLAMLRADQSMRNAQSLEDPMTNMLGLVSSGLSGVASIL